jgi:hypothetical protein
MITILSWLKLYNINDKDEHESLYIGGCYYHEAFFTVTRVSQR